MSEKRGCFKVGCLGCLGTAAIVLVVVVFLVVLGLLTGGGDSRIEPLERSHVLPSIEPSLLPRGTLAAPFEDERGRNEILDIQLLD